MYHKHHTLTLETSMKKRLIMVGTLILLCQLITASYHQGTEGVPFSQLSPLIVPYETPASAPVRDKKVQQETAPTEQDGPPLMIKVLPYGIDALKALIDNGFSIDAVDLEGNTVLHHAVNQGFEEVVMFLLERKPTIDKQNNAGETPLIRAAIEHNSSLMIAILLRDGANPSLLDQKGNKYLDYLTPELATEVVTLIK